MQYVTKITFSIWPHQTSRKFGWFFKHLASAAKNVVRKMLKNPSKSLEIAAMFGNAAASELVAATAPDI